MLTINDREGMELRGEVTSAKEENGGRVFLSEAAMMVDVRVTVGL